MTLRQAIQAKITQHTAIAAIKADAAAAIAPLQTKIEKEQERLVKFDVWLDFEVSVAKTKVGAILDTYL